MKESAGDDASVVEIWTPLAPDEASIVARSTGTGAIEAVRSASDLQIIVGSKVPSNVRSSLEAGGVAWGPGYSGARLWNTSHEPARSISLPSSASFGFDERWARDNAGFILTSTARGLGLKLANQVSVVDGLSSREALQLTEALSSRGYDPRIVSTFKSGDTYSISPFQWTVVFLLGIVGIVIALAAMRSSMRSLRKQTSAVSAIGAPRSWIASVFIEETGTSYILGAALGGASSIFITNVGLQRLNVLTDFPTLALGLYVGLLCVALFIIVLSGVRYISGSPREST